MDIVFLILGIGTVLLGVGGLLSLTLIPRLKRVWPYDTWLFLGRLPNTLRNQAAVSFYLVGAGLYMVLADSLYAPWNDIALATFALVTVLYLFARQPERARS